MSLSVQEFNAAVEVAIVKADEATENMYAGQYNTFMGCGFAWVKTYVDGRSKLGRVVAKSEKFSKEYNGGYSMWTKGVASATQNVVIKEFWCARVAEVLNANPATAEFKFSMLSRLD